MLERGQVKLAPPVIQSCALLEELSHDVVMQQGDDLVFLFSATTEITRVREARGERSAACCGYYCWWIAFVD
jgi:hypothetical protein